MVLTNKSILFPALSIFQIEKLPDPEYPISTTAGPSHFLISRTLSPFPEKEIGALLNVGKRVDVGRSVDVGTINVGNGVLVDDNVSGVKVD